MKLESIAAAMTEPTQDDLKASRSRYAGWLSRAIKNYESHGSSTSILEVCKERIATQLKKLQDANDRYVTTLTDDGEVETAEQWMDDYFSRAATILEEIDNKLHHDKRTDDVKHPTVRSMDTLQSSRPAEGSKSNDEDETAPTQEAPPGEKPLQNSDSPEASETSAISSETSETSAIATPRSKTSIDAWIDGLVVGQETVSTPVRADNDLNEVLARLHIERDLPKIELPSFDGSPLLWPRFVEQFFNQVHSKPGLDDSRRMDLLQSHVKGEAKRLIEGLGYSARNYAQSLKELKFAFGHRVAVARAYVNAVTSGSPLPTCDSTALRNFYISVRDCTTTLRQMDYTDEIRSSDVLQRASRRIPADKRTKWNDFVCDICRRRNPNLDDLERWLKNCIQAEFNPYAIASPRQPQQRNVIHNQARQSTINAISSSPQPDAPSCPICTASHHLSRCSNYTSKSPEERYQLVKSLRLCFNCLSGKHVIANCRSTVTCKASGCSKKHHTTLHRQAEGRIYNAQRRQVSSVCFQVLPVVVQGSNGRSVSTYALLDSASDISMISDDLAKDLGLNGRLENLTLNTVSSTSSIPSQRVKFSIRARDEPFSQRITVTEAWTKPGIFKCPPVQVSHLIGTEAFNGVTIQDIPRDQVKLLIGANVPKAHIQIDNRLGPSDGIVAIQTVLGWCVMGPSMLNSCNRDAHVNLILEEQDQLSRQVEQFWSTESFGVTANFKKPTSMNDLRASDILKKGTVFKDGHFEVPMLWKDETQRMPDNRKLAEMRFQSLDKRLSRDLNLQERYSSVMNGYIANGYARKLTPDEESAAGEKTWYLPHHCVLNPNKPEKVRVVFDAASVFQGVSLNNQLMTGPDLANNLLSVIQRFRLKPVALVADIKEMFHQVKVPENASDSLRFLWKEDLQQPGPAEVYKMQVHIFGARDSPACVNYALRQSAANADDVSREVILHNFYVDDMLAATDDTASAISLARSVSEVLSAHGFLLTKWMSSSREVLADLPDAVGLRSEVDMDLEKQPLQRALGLTWNVDEDCFVFNPKMKSPQPTKRSIISIVSSIFDPCGFLTPFTFRAKNFIQKLWRAGLDWDDGISSQMYEEWNVWYQEIPTLSQLHIPRYHGCQANMDLQLHLFSDASEAGFAAVAYLRMSTGNTVHCSFLASKCHIAPIKQALTTPKLELQGATMAVRLSVSLAEDIKVEKIVFWTDATTVLRYINNPHKRWKIFVANRVSEIREFSEPSQWRYVPSKQNPADDATRGLTAELLVKSDRWIRGPSFLWNSEEFWPQQPEISPPSDSHEDLRKPVYAVMSTNTAPGDSKVTFNLHSVIQPKEFSSWFRLLRHAAWVRRSVKNFIAFLPEMGVTAVTQALLSSSELLDAEVNLVYMAQKECFTKELQSLQRGECIDRKSSLLPLNPFLDATSTLLRVGGRLKEAPGSVEVRHQIILPYDHHISRLIAHDLHVKLAHCGPEHLIANLRVRFWPVKCRQLAKNVIYSCLQCRRRTVKPTAPLMADLPVQRISGFTRPFQFIGLDYFGPLLSKRARSTVKKWGCIFTCMVTRAVHLELADSLLTDDFIMVLRCFVSRRGPPTEIFSDNGTNFRGADKELTQHLNQLDQERVNRFLLQTYTKWNFIPPHAPHFGGAWESLVKSVKRSLKAVLKEQVVQESVLRTTLIEVESVINSRPLTYNSADPDDFTALTPNHFLHGGATSVASPGEFCEKDLCSRKRWRQSQVLADHIWRRWTKEYLPTLTVRRHWQSEERNLQRNDLVLLQDDNLPRGQWHLGRILEVYPSKDDRVRSVKVRTARGEYCRPSAKICLLEEGYEDC